MDTFNLSSATLISKKKKLHPFFERKFLLMVDTVFLHSIPLQMQELSDPIALYSKVESLTS